MQVGQNGMMNDVSFARSAGAELPSFPSKVKKSTTKDADKTKDKTKHAKAKVSCSPVEEEYSTPEPKVFSPP